MADSACKPLVLCGPSGSGKSSLLNKLLKDHPNKFGFSVSHTTRKPRSGEVDGVHYHFTDLDTIQGSIAKGDFIENAEYSGNMYGTSKMAVQDVLNQGKVCILDIDVQGAEQVKSTEMKPLMVFVRPPSIEELEVRLRARNTETEQSLALRLDTAKKEIKYGMDPNNFHKIIVNDDLDRAYKELKEFIFSKVQFQADDAE